MILLGSKHKMIIGIDPASKEIRCMRIAGVDPKSAVVDMIPFRENVFSAEFYPELQRLLEEYLRDKPSFQALAAYLVLPDRAVGADTLNIPVMKAQRMEQNFQNEVEKLYRDHKGLNIRHYVAFNNKQYATYALTVVRKDILANLYRALANNKFYPKRTTYAANATLDAVLHLRPRLRGRSFLFLDVKERRTAVVVSGKGKTMGYAELALGYANLPSDRVLQEQMQYDHDVAELAVLNAKEAAKAKLLTEMEESGDGENLESVADSVAEQLAALPALTLSDERDDGNSPSEPQDEAAAFDAEEAEEEEREHRAAEIAAARKRKVFVRKMPKRLPKFMIRPLPETPEGFLAENFRMIAKWALLYRAQLRLEEYIPEPEFVLVNLPAEYASAVEAFNREGDSGIEFRCFDPRPEGNCDLTLNLDLYGILFAGRFNQNQNF